MNRYQRTVTSGQGTFKILSNFPIPKGLLSDVQRLKLPKSAEPAVYIQIIPVPKDIDTKTTEEVSVVQETPK